MSDTKSSSNPRSELVIFHPELNLGSFWKNLLKKNRFMRKKRHSEHSSDMFCWNFGASPNFQLETKQSASKLCENIRELCYESVCASGPAWPGPFCVKKCPMDRFRWKENQARAKSTDVESQISVRPIHATMFGHENVLLRGRFLNSTKVTKAQWLCSTRRFGRKKWIAKLNHLNIRANGFSKFTASAKHIRIEKLHRFNTRSQF